MTEDNGFYDEYILCPKCRTIEKTKVMHSTSKEQAFIHKCTKCGFFIKQGNWKAYFNLKQNNIDHEHFYSGLLMVERKQILIRTNNHRMINDYRMSIE